MGKKTKIVLGICAAIVAAAAALTVAGVNLGEAVRQGINMGKKQIKHI